jgi:hypothetical protein
MSDANRALAETFLRMLNEHDPNLVYESVAVDYINHNPFVADGREANRGDRAGAPVHDGLCALPRGLSSVMEA